MKGIVWELGEMKIQLCLDTKLVNKHPYKLNPKYKEKVWHELANIIDVGIIVPIERL